MNDVLLSKEEYEKLLYDICRLRDHLALVALKNPDASTFTIVAESPWLTEARLLIEATDR